MGYATNRNDAVRNLVFKRDRGICQCCGSTNGSEVHHIEPVYLGGLDTEDNLITLCSSCHRLAPNDAEDFLEYQKTGGAVWQRMSGRLMYAWAKTCPAMTLEQFHAQILNMRLSVFQESYNSAPVYDVVSTTPAISDWAKEDILKILGYNKYRWLSAHEIYSLLPEPNSRFDLLKFKRLLDRLCHHGLIKKILTRKTDSTRRINVYGI